MSFSRQAIFALSAVAAASALMLGGCATGGAASTAAVKSVDFTETAAPAATEVDKMSKTYTESSVKVTYVDGSVKTYPLSYNTLFSLKDATSEVGGKKHPAGQLYNYKMEPLMDPKGKPLVAETPDSNSLLQVGDKLFMVTHLEYDWLLSDGTVGSKVKDWHARAPMGMLLSELKQNGDGQMSLVKQRPIDFSSVGGLWIPCFGSQTPWNTHLGSEEDYDLQFNPLTKDHGKTSAGLQAMTDLYFKGEKLANRYHYGYLNEVAVKPDGSTQVTKHYAMGRGTWEMGKIMPDSKTVYFGDDGTHGLMAMFVADQPGKLDAGTIYAAKWEQTSDQGGGRANLTWVKLGHGNSAEIKALADSSSFYKIFSAVKPKDGTCEAGYTRVRTGSTADECLKLNPGQEKAAAFLETRRMAALMGATTEFTKMEGVAVNAKDKRLYMAISSIRDSMTSMTGEPTDHIRLAKNSAGATYSLDMKGGQMDAKGAAMASDYVAVNMYVEPALLGEPIKTPDAKGNTAAEGKVANTDNVFFSDKMRTLFIGEDSGMHVNNYLWAYNVDTKKLTRIMSSAAGAENTGLQVLDNLNGHGYIMANNQHWGDLPSSVPADLKTALGAKIDKFNAPVGYLGGMPAIR